MAMFIEFIKKNKILVIIVLVIAVVGILALAGVFNKSPFKNVLISNTYDRIPPKEFPPLSELDSGGISLAPPVVPEEIGLAMVYPQGSGVGMSKDDSNSFEPTNPGPLLTNYTIPESYGESSLSDPMGTNGAGQGARVLKIKSTGNQMMYQPIDESLPGNFAEAYSDGGSVQDGSTLINNSSPINYNNDYNPNNNLSLQTSPGQMSTIPNCESTYPNVVKYGDLCITTGDIPYGQVVDGIVNPRLVSRWESFTGDYSRQAALTPIDGVLYPNLNVMVK